MVCFPALLFYLYGKILMEKQQTGVPAVPVKLDRNNRQPLYEQLIKDTPAGHSVPGERGNDAYRKRTLHTVWD
jgi:hypothetical protein